MRSSDAAVALVLVLAWTSHAEAQQPAQGFGVERLYPSAPGGGWMVMDALDMRGGIGGAAEATVGYAHDPLRVAAKNGDQQLAVVSRQAFAAFGFAATYDRFRLHLNFSAPLAIGGNSGVVGAYQFTAPPVDLGTNPDTLTDARIGADVRLLGAATSSFRLGAGVQLFVPNGNRSDYVSDGTYRAMGRVLFAGDAGLFTYAGQIGVHVRPLDDSPTPGSPQGSELLFGAAAGVRLPMKGRGSTAFIVGPEIYGATAFRSLFGTTTMALEGLLTGRFEGTADDGPQGRVKVGAGAGLNHHFGAPDWRLVFAIEVFNHHADRDDDGVSDSKDACPDQPGEKSQDTKGNGCPLDRDQDGVPDVEDVCPDVIGARNIDPRRNGCADPGEDTESVTPAGSLPLRK